MSVLDYVYVCMYTPLTDCFALSLEEIEDRFWTRADDYKLYSRKNEDVESLLGKHSAIEVVHRTTYLTKTRQAARQFEVAHDAMEKSGLLKRARGRFDGRGESKRQRAVAGDQ